MTLDDIQKGESDMLEFKADLPSEKEKYIKTAVAFANGNGGTIVFGVKNGTWKPIGFPKDEIFQKMDAISSSIFDACSPKIVPAVEVLDINGKLVITATISPGSDKPYFIKKQGIQEGCYVRIGATTRKADPETVKELMLQSSLGGFDVQPASREALSEGRIAKLCNRMYRHAKENIARLDLGERLRKLTVSQLVSWRLLIKESGKYFPTNGYLLLENGDASFSNAYIQCAVFKDTTRSQFVDRKEIRGPIDEQVDAATNYVLNFISMGSRIDGVFRSDAYELPALGIREMIANAVCHRSYVRSGAIQLAVYSDRLEVTSPGRLSDTLSISEIIKGSPFLRNKALGAAFIYMHIIESWGSGIPRLFRDAQSYGLKPPEIENRTSSLRVSLYRKPQEFDDAGVVLPDDNTAAPATDKTTAIMALMRSDPEITLKHLSEKLGIKLSTVKYYVKKLSDAQEIRRSGNRQRGRWEVMTGKK